MKFPVLFRWILALATVMECEAAAVRLSWVGMGAVGDNRFGLHSKVLGGGDPDPTYLVLPERTESLTVHEGSIYFTQATDNTYNSSNVFRTDRQGGSQTPLYQVPHSNTSWGFVVTDEYLYLSDSLFDTISRSNLDGSGVETVFDAPRASPSPAYMAGTDDRLYWLQFAVSAKGQSQLWYFDHSDPSQAVALLTGLSEPRFLSASSSNLFWFDSMDRVIYRTDLNGLNRQVIVSNTWARGLVVDDDYVYWANNYNLLRSDHNGGNIQTILTSSELIGDLFLESVPEPGTFLLGGLSALVLLGRRRRGAKA